MSANLIIDSLTKNLAGLFTPSGEVEIEKTCEFLQTSKKELAESFGLSADQLRQGRLASVTKERLTQLAGVIEFLSETFMGDLDKTKLWLNAPNMNFGGASPRSLILSGRFNKVQKFILSTKQGY